MIAVPIVYPYCTVYVTGRRRERVEGGAEAFAHSFYYPGDRDGPISYTEVTFYYPSSSGTSSTSSTSSFSTMSMRRRDSQRSKMSSRVASRGATRAECVIKSTDMSEELQAAAIEVTLTALEKHRVEKDIATYIKEEFDREFSPTWHVVVGRNFGSYVTHETNHFIYFYVQNVAIMLFKTGI